jgi:hypothetical protein
VPMLVIRAFAAFGTGAMAAAILAGFTVASFPEEGGALLGLAWGRVTLIDIYLAFGLGWVWIAWRETSPVRAGLWLVATLVTGSLALFAYLLGASMRSDTVSRLVLGPHRSPPTTPIGATATVSSDH